MMRPGANKVGDNLTFIMPDFIHPIGHFGHHTSRMLTVSDARFRLHENLDDLFFYPAQSLLRKYLGYGRLYVALRGILGLFWGLNCNFPARDVALYLVWFLRGCKPIAVFKKIPGAKFWGRSY